MDSEGTASPAGGLLRTAAAHATATVPVLAVGVILAAVMLPLNLLLWKQVGLALAVSTAVLLASGTATVIGLALPWALDRMRLDPAFGSGPLGTVLQDLTTILIYFAVATAIVF